MVRTLSEAKRIAILDAAKKIFLKDGFETAKIADIASEAGVASGTVYLYFKSKEAILAAIFESRFVLLGKEFATVVQKLQTPDDVVLLIDWATQVAETMNTVAEKGQHPNGEKGQGQPLLYERSNLRAMFVEQLHPVLQNLIDEGIVRKYEDADVLADLIVLTLRELVFSHRSHDKAYLSRMKRTTTAFLQHVLFDDLTIAAQKMASKRRPQ